MPEPGSQNSRPQSAPSELEAALRTGGRARSSLFKYYIHDSINECRLKFLGDLSEADIAELQGCWRTARTTLGQRKLVLDLRRLKTVDDAGSRWLACMAGEGATYLPESYLRTGLINGIPSDTNSVRRKPGPLARALSLIRGARIAAAD